MLVVMEVLMEADAIYLSDHNPPAQRPLWWGSSDEREHKTNHMGFLSCRSVGVKGDTQTISLPGISIPKKHCREMRDVEICKDSTVSEIAPLIT